ncbi:MAG: hypothetical protein A3H06_01450 [Candidatus Colwellbacteria bacterium RIFCSPLOWO2_12_FULL_44_13]|uniref:Uncharacterized protein n=2 Tax=Candidatus Colwelliibacteriota TaxID=1817904 RepID=A0A1G1Z279_9BACT|nr:MAG: hypothetical protein A3F24_02230 [Candidatus Colwellbacteria bacterium RIFCSPHIGHO2_12_FULL_44_17]OGY61340.1 MAG: hypothetical protein A3H06_01450 [Candidatus Colwellbacteria bacterium RIFCSPLOWO2_12_FULL_44_13]
MSYSIFYKLGFVVILAGLLFFLPLPSISKPGIPTDTDTVIADVVLPIRWGELGKQMVAAGVIDAKKFENLYLQRGGLNEEEQRLLFSDAQGLVVMTEDNASYLLNLLWAFGLGNKNLILEQGPIMDSEYGGAGRFASTGGWTLSQGDSMEHYSMHQFIVLTAEQQALVELVSQNIYRPCCGNSTYFPDCNHGMAMLGLLELMAVNGASEEEMYRVALAVNSLWFPDTYRTIAQFLAEQGISWDEIDAKKVLGFAYSSASGFQSIAAQVTTLPSNQGGSCGV